MRPKATVNVTFGRPITGEEVVGLVRQVAEDPSQGLHAVTNDEASGAVSVGQTSEDDVYHIRVTPVNGATFSLDATYSGVTIMSHRWPGMTLASVPEQKQYEDAVLGFMQKRKAAYQEACKTIRFPTYTPSPSLDDDEVW